MAAQQGWTEFRPLVAAIYREPTNVWVFERAFRCLRAFDGVPVSRDLIAAARALKESGYCGSPITKKELGRATKKLLGGRDREAALVYALYVTCTPLGKGETNRGRRAAVDILRTFPPSRVRPILRVFGENFPEFLQGPVKSVQAQLESAWTKQRLGWGLALVVIVVLGRVVICEFLKRRREPADGLQD